MVGLIQYTYVYTYMHVVAHLEGGEAPPPPPPKRVLSYS